ncbi:Kinesin light chain 4 [Trichoplax sp. H2]|uniref:Kinesin light chain n=1 Tax=Trichoplax adhaerens TaxID=10228 RepID=B3SAZ7_TRIAD|nr:hypothetical protein TRIADDRAFT_61438 [Trichoplax adhaerens]EDV20021.1 hypothetical protein TRIADDRAFT_61438 [Trichoplax adhaerens]RDD45589.1 Kinesin light chain 4 [Trichoplax sp. H2]|eukprot:XP_002117405.1 hypothetical protein TRIADDRAFT_61438 [Trichoplax adhaerens]
MGQKPSHKVKLSIGGRSDDRIQHLLQSGRRYRQHKDYERAKKQYIKALDSVINNKLEKVLYRNRLLLEIFLDISRCHRKLLQVDEANYYCRLAENVAKQIRNQLANDHSLDSISDCDMKKQDHAALDTHNLDHFGRNELRSYDLAIGILYGKIGRMYFAQCKYSEALPICKTAINIQTTLRSKCDQDIATLYDVIGHVYKYKSKYDEALSHYQASLNMRQELKETNKLDLANSYENIADIYSRQRKLDDALSLYETSRNLRQEILGNDAIEIKHSNGRITKILYLQDKHNDL